MKRNVWLLIAGLLVFVGCASNPHKRSTKIYIQQKNYEKAIREAKAWIKDEPNNPEAYQWLAMAYAGKKMYIEGAEAIVKAMDLDTAHTLKLGDPEINLLLLAGKEAFKKGDYQNAAKYFKYAQKLAPKNKSVLLSLALIYSKMGKIEKAQKCIEKVKSLDPKNPDIYVNEANLYDTLSVLHPDKKAEYLKKAENSYKKAIELKPEKKYYLLLAAFYNRHMKDDSSYIQKAVETMKKAYQSDTTDLSVLYDLGTVSYRAKDYKTAAWAMEKYLEKKPDDIEAKKTLGIIYLAWVTSEKDKKNQKEIAKKGAKIYEELLQKEPDNMDYLQSLYIFYVKFDKPKAKKVLKKIKKLEKK